MPFPFTHDNGGVCCSAIDGCCDNCKAKLVAEARAAGRTPRGAAGKRPSAADQHHLDQAAAHLVKAGANVTDDIEEDMPSLSADATFQERYAAQRSREFATLRAATRQIEAQSAANPPTMRALEEPDDVPTAWDTALADRQPTQHDIEPRFDPNYQPPRRTTERLHAGARAPTATEGRRRTRGGRSTTRGSALRRKRRARWLRGGHRQDEERQPMTTKADTPPTVDAVLANLQQQLADLGDPREIERVRDAFYAQEAILSWRIDAIRTGTWNVAQAEAAIPDVERWFNFLTEARRTLCDELAAMPSRIYDERTLGRQQNVKLSILKIDRDVDTDPWCLESLRVGDLLRAAGYVEGPKIENQVVGKLPWHGSLPEAERRLTKLRLDLADAQARLKNALMSDEERAAEAAEVARRNALPVRKTRGDGSRYDLWPDGRIVEVDATV